MNWPNMRELLELKMTDKTAAELKMMVDALPIRETAKAYLNHILLFEEEGQKLIEYLKDNPNAGAEKMKVREDEITDEMNQKTGLTATQRDLMYGR